MCSLWSQRAFTSSVTSSQLIDNFVYYFLLVQNDTLIIQAIIHSSNFCFYDFHQNSFWFANFYYYCQILSLKHGPLIIYYSLKLFWNKHFLRLVKWFLCLLLILKSMERWKILSQFKKIIKTSKIIPKIIIIPECPYCVINV